MVDVKQAIKEANEYADKAIRESINDIQGVRKTVRTLLSSGNYHLTNVHVVTWLGITVLLCIIF